MAVGLLLADDLSPENVRVVASGLDLARRLGIPAAVLHVVTDEALEGFRRGQPDDQEAYHDVFFDRLRDQLRARVVEAVGAEAALAIPLHVVRGEPADAVVKHLEEGEYEFGVIGVRRRSRVGKLVFGSSAQSILLLSPCPMVTVHTE